LGLSACLRRTFDVNVCDRTRLCTVGYTLRVRERGHSISRQSISRRLPCRCRDRARSIPHSQSSAPRVATLGIREVLSAPASPWQNPYVERVIGSIRRECFDHVIVFNQRHLRRTVAGYLSYYHDARTHLALEERRADAAPRTSGDRRSGDRRPGSRRLAPSVRTTGRLTASGGRPTDLPDRRDHQSDPPCSRQSCAIETVRGRAEGGAEPILSLAEATGNAPLDRHCIGFGEAQGDERSLVSVWRYSSRALSRQLLHNSPVHRKALRRRPRRKSKR
jgi:hypothetical protein